MQKFYRIRYVGCILKQSKEYLKIKKEEIMIEAVYQIGKSLEHHNSGKSIVSEWIENPNKNGKYNNICFIVFQKTSTGYVYNRSELMNYKQNLIERYAYRSGSANGANLSPSAKLTEVQKTVNNKIIKWFAKYKDSNVVKPEEKELLENIEQELVLHTEKIIEDCTKSINGIPNKESKFVSLLFEELDEDEDEEVDWKYLGDFPVFNNIILSECTKSTKGYSKESHTCCFCGNKSKKVMGNMGVYTFYTIDKTGFIDGGFNEHFAWKNYPVCIDCKKTLEHGKNFVETSLKYRFAGIPFYLIPKSILGDQEAISHVLDILIKDPDQKIRNPKLSLSKDGKNELKSITNNEISILEAIGGNDKQKSYQLQDNISFHLLFLEKSNSAERITMHIEDVLPSQISRILESKEKTDSFFQNSVLDKTKKFTFGTLRAFFSKTDPNNRDDDLRKYFFELIDHVFKNNKISMKWIMSFFMHKIRCDFIQEDKYTFHSIRKALKSILFLSNLKLLNFKKEESMIEENRFDELVFKKFGNTFQSNAKKGLFLLGALNETLLRKQYAERNSKPFQKNLKSLKMNMKDFKGLLPKIQNKLEEYKSFDKGKREIAKEVSTYLLAAGENWNLSLDEMNFYFVSGMNLCSEVTSVVYSKEDFEKEELNNQGAENEQD